MNKTSYLSRRLTLLTVIQSQAICAALAIEGHAAEPDHVLKIPSYRVLQVEEPIVVDGRLDEPAWFAAPKLVTFHFPWHKKGEKEQTIVKLLWDSKNLYIAHVCQDAYITARYSEHDDPVAKDDCIELMVAPDARRRNNYYNIEWNVQGAYVDGHRPDGPTGPRPAWDVQGLRLAGSYAGKLNDDTVRDTQWTCELAIPFSNFANDMHQASPRPGDQWRLNINRHGGDTNPQYSQWSPGDTAEPAFHTPHRFGQVMFVAEQSPFPRAVEKAN
jgi:hypothetical protein